MIITKLITANDEYADYKYTETRDGKRWGVFRVWLDGSKYDMLEPHYPKDREQCFLYLHNIALRTYEDSKRAGHPIDGLFLQFNTP